MDEISLREQNGFYFIKKSVKWLKPEEPTTIQGHNISSGMIYVGELLLDTSDYDNEHCLVNPKLKVIKNKYC